MHGLAKFALGIIGTLVLAALAQNIDRERIVGKLTQQAMATLAEAGVGDATVVFQPPSGMTRRVALLGGTAAPADRERLRLNVAAQTGINDAVWVGALAPVAVVVAPVAAPVVVAPPTPVEAAVAVAQDCQETVDAAILGKTINFISGSADIDPAAAPLLDSIGTALAACPDTLVEVNGHTDRTGGDNLNRPLSKARADAVAAALGERGIAADRMTTAGFAADQPAELVPGADANASNRRIEFKLAAR